MDGNLVDKQPSFLASQGDRSMSAWLHGDPVTLGGNCLIKDPLYPFFSSLLPSPLSFQCLLASPSNELLALLI